MEEENSESSEACEYYIFT